MPSPERSVTGAGTMLLRIGTVKMDEVDPVVSGSPPFASRTSRVVAAACIGSQVSAFFPGRATNPKARGFESSRARRKA